MMLVISSRSPRMEEFGRTRDFINGKERKVKRGKGNEEEEVKVRRRRRRKTLGRWADEMDGERG